MRLNSPADLEKKIREEFPELNIDISGSGDIAVLSRIVVPENKRSEGIGSRAMKRLINMADAGRITLSLTPTTDFGSKSKKRLEQFYKRFGFVLNRGRNKDFRTREEMIRSPK